ncbi:mechanosensitive ion channel family protein [Alteromonas sp. ASW11-19]|uniref:Small-conductance mechanosensitive channel n=1 Tax=Alteromonas salexigens TaxID=2982530 RepID=A0ABT2VKQ3_9ALTE|nr:mechanosensitive ion channel family protein [Alteromonas salexigens]MCU7553880.1 mechanosensitive ion channel family protein [Alteromonas salexigens]
MQQDTTSGEGPAGVSDFASMFSDFWLELMARLPAIGVGLLLLIAAVLLAAPLARLVLRPFDYVTQSDLIRSVSRRSVSIIIILLGTYLFLKLAGLTEFAVAIISGTGMIGLILGFAFRDIAENFISSLLLTVQRPFRIGDVVQINDFMGVVQKVTSRATTLVDFDGNHIQIPNATIYKGVIKNFTANPRMRGHFVIGIGYDSNAKAAQSLALSVMQAHPNVLADPEPQVLVDNLGSATLNLKVYFWIDVEQTSVLKMASVLMRDLVGAFEEQGISMPDDAREIIFPEGIAVSMQQADESNTHKASSETKPAKPVKQPVKPQRTSAKSDVGADDVSSETDDIRRQAAEARDPEAGGNIL